MIWLTAAFASLLVGLLRAFGTPWGLIRQLDGISYVAAVARETTLSSSDLVGLRQSLRTHAAGSLLCCCCSWVFRYTSRGE